MRHDYPCADCDATLTVRPEGLALFGGGADGDWFMVKDVCGGAANAPASAGSFASDAWKTELVANSKRMISGAVQR
jgi:hypothetical protein